MPSISPSLFFLHLFLTACSFCSYCSHLFFLFFVLLVLVFIFSSIIVLFPSSPFLPLRLLFSLYRTIVCSSPSRFLRYLLMLLSQTVGTLAYMANLTEVDMFFWTGDNTPHDIWKQNELEQLKRLQVLLLIFLLPRSRFLSSLPFPSPFPSASLSPLFICSLLCLSFCLCCPLVLVLLLFSFSFTLLLLVPFLFHLS
jgi:hypothetical protein